MIKISSKMFYGFVSVFKQSHLISGLIYSHYMITRLMSRSASPVTKKPKKAPILSSAGFKTKDQENHQNTINDDAAEYVIDGPLRRVKPYYFTYLTYCKLRWRDRTLLDIFSNEFRDRSIEYYSKSIESGKVLLNGKVAQLDTLVRNGDLITHRIHRHEPPVSSREIKIVKETDELIVIDKPGGVPVHPTGRYRFNTVTKILKLEKSIEAHPCNRLDRLTSGLMFLAKNPKGADKFVEQLKAREVQKEYIARVKGVFPDDEIVVDKPVNTIDPRLGLNYIDESENGKSANTTFKKISSDGETSIVKCMPHTGRTHQIRVHLQYLGHPIANDPIYSNKEHWGEELGRHGKADLDKVRVKLDKVGKTESAKSWFYPDSNGELLLDQKCESCDTELYSDPGPNDLSLWLHAYKYYSTDDENPWSYETEFPDWALEPHIAMMELALEQALKCELIENAFSVGAVLAHDGEVLSTGYTRELEGNTHAEQNALEKYFQKVGERKLPKGTVVYTTMEPCSLRLSGNLPCVDRILEFEEIKSVFVGVMEPDTFVKKNVGLEKLKQKGVEYVKVPGFEERALEVAFRGHEKVK